MLGKRNQLKIEFEESRRVHADQIIKAVFTLAGDTLAFDKYIDTVAGFFVIESSLMLATQDFRSKSSVFP